MGLLKEVAVSDTRPIGIGFYWCVYKEKDRNC